MAFLYLCTYDLPVWLKNCWTEDQQWSIFVALCSTMSNVVFIHQIYLLISGIVTWREISGSIINNAILSTQKTKVSCAYNMRRPAWRKTRRRRRHSNLEWLFTHSSRIFLWMMQSRLFSELWSSNCAETGPLLVEVVCFSSSFCSFISYLWNKQWLKTGNLVSTLTWGWCILKLEILLACCMQLIDVLCGINFDLDYNGLKLLRHSWIWDDSGQKAPISLLECFAGFDGTHIQISMLGCRLWRIRMLVRS